MSKARCPSSSFDSGTKREREHEGRDPDRDVDEEDPRPGEEVGEDAAEQQADGAAARGDRAPDAHRLRPLLALREGRRHDRERGRRDERGAEALEPAREDQELGRGREPVQERGDGEDDDAGEEEPLPAEQVAGAAAEEQEAAEDQRVRVDDPLQLASASCPGPSGSTGSATFTTVASRMTMNCARQTRTRTSHGIRAACGHSSATCRSRLARYDYPYVRGEAGQKPKRNWIQEERRKTLGDWASPSASAAARAAATSTRTRPSSRPRARSAAASCATAAPRAPRRSRPRSRSSARSAARRCARTPCSASRSASPAAEGARARTSSRGSPRSGSP